jgi:hypothetical protein
VVLIGYFSGHLSRILIELLIIVEVIRVIQQLFVCLCVVLFNPAQGEPQPQPQHQVTGFDIDLSVG